MDNNLHKAEINTFGIMCIQSDSSSDNSSAKNIVHKGGQRNDNSIMLDSKWHLHYVNNKAFRLIVVKNVESGILEASIAATLWPQRLKRWESHDWQRKSHCCKKENCCTYARLITATLKKAVAARITTYQHNGGGYKLNDSDNNTGDVNVIFYKSPCSWQWQ